MHLSYSPAHYLRFSCRHSFMATAISNSCFNGGTSTHHPLLNTTHISPPPKIPSFSQNPIKSPFLKEICKQGNLKGAFQSLTYLFIDNNSLLISPDEAYAQVLELCAKKKALLQGRQTHGSLIKYYNGTSESLFLDTKLVFMYGKCGSITDAEKVFDKMSERTIFTWNALLGAYVSNGEPLGALKTYREMRVLGIPLDAYTFPSVLKACSVLKDLNCGAEIHGLVIKCGYDSIAFVVNSLVAMYAKCHELVKAKQLFDKVGKTEDVVLWNSIISAYSANGYSMEALDVFRNMQKGGLVTNSYTFVAALQACEDSLFKKLGMEIHAAILKSSHKLEVYVGNALIALYARCGKMTEAERVLNSLEDKDEVSWNSMLTGFVQNGSALMACSGLKCRSRLKEINGYIIRKGLSDLVLQNSVVDVYGESGNIIYARKMFESIESKDIVSWTSMMSTYVHNGLANEALEIFYLMNETNVEPDSIAIVSILSAAASLSASKKGKEIHGFVIRTGFMLEGSLASSLVDMYARCGALENAYKTKARTTLEPTNSQSTPPPPVAAAAVLQYCI
ncbi:hypothetical protein Patl1_03288 [Pistacia atlantica]|uniref:Uncharacterized protein n=1 Tax=Pistacia atlantica TaxID=434234 RepID=A0ACC1C4A8_9ROSI|nr:hypothetical protein Patl1_03288 [Pistacia atlantica]